MSMRMDIDPTAGRVIGHDAGRRLDEGLEWLTELDLNLLYDSSNGMSIRQMSRRHRVPEPIIKHIMSMERIRRSVASAGVTPADSEAYSRLVQRLEELAAPRCRSCRAVLRKALEPRRRGRPPKYCDARCRAAGAKDPSPPRWQAGYVGTCHHYLHGCKCEHKDTITADDDMVFLTPRGDILLCGLPVGRISDHYVEAQAMLIDTSVPDYDRRRLAAAGEVPVEFVPTPDITRHTAIRLLAGLLRAQPGGARKVAIHVSDRLDRLRAKAFDFRAAVTIDGRSALVWNLDKHPPPPVHVVA